MNGFANYQSSRLNLNIEEEKFANLHGPLQELRNFGRRFLENNSIAKVVSSGTSPKDEDWIVKLLMKGNQGRLRVSHGDEEVTIYNCSTNMQVGEFGKLRSIARVDDVDGERVVVKNNFTSLIKVH